MRPMMKPHLLTPPRALAGGFALIIAIGTLLLSLPVAVNGNGLPFIDALFTAVSATCVTGLTVVDTASQFSYFGKIVLLALMQIGGLGFMTTATWFAIAFNRRISLRDQLILKESMNQSNMEGLVRLAGKVFLFSAVIELCGTIGFALRWAAEMPLGQAVWHGFFHAVSIFNNGGFELFGGFTDYAEDPFINLVTIVLVIFGSLGFIVLSELIEYPKTRSLSLHSKVVLTASGILIGAGAIVLAVFEFTNARTLGTLDWEGKLLAPLFQSVGLRSAGINTLPIAELRSATQFFMILMMFVGAAPGSTGGGIKITTFVVLLAALVAMTRGREDVVLFRRRIDRGDIYRAIAVTMLSVFVVIVATLILTAVQHENFLMLLFEAASAFGTVGYSMGLTPKLSLAGKIVVIVLMFTGRVGLITFALALQPKPRKELFRYPEGKITIG
ncbi:TrkH family potassium uptake protein [Paenibacillus beijingensis]|uniref:ATP synthase subunit J n=1 Tax=Paenibacillus beijingensis TaxID=1126833 RepID=A0A0D5NFX3_9BACL|nr:TrkH family potassium uptake protein [Paenibacillus beijingensis]AJY73877.1 ATP synthase subunit J [Paenibacillus beijingensis]